MSRIDEIEGMIARNEMTAAQVFTQMRQLIKQDKKIISGFVVEMLYDLNEYQSVSPQGLNEIALYVKEKLK